MKKITEWVPCMLGLLSIIYFCICVSDSGWITSGIWVWPLFSVICFIVSFILFYMHRKGKSWKEYTWARVFAACTGLLFTMFFIFEANVLYGMYQCGIPDLDYVMILGGGVVGETPSPPLMKRILTAYEYLEEFPDTKAIAAGGLGDQDTWSEGACIKKELVNLGIDPDRILVEDKSTTTAENMRFSRKLIHEENFSVGIVSSSFHIYRSVLTAKSAGFPEVYGIAAPFHGVMVPHYMVREFMTFTVDVILGNIRWEF